MLLRVPPTGKKSEGPMTTHGRSASGTYEPLFAAHRNGMVHRNASLSSYNFCFVLPRAREMLMRKLEFILTKRFPLIRPGLKHF